MNPEEKTRDLLQALDRRSNIAPRSGPTDSRLTSIQHIPWKTPFSIFNPSHLKAASDLLHVLLAENEFDGFMDLVNEAQSFENDDVFLYTIYSSVRHRDDCKGVVLPPIEERAPHWFFAAETIHEAIQRSIHEPNDDHLVINQRTAEDVEPENRLAYFREDVGMNRHHWAWHVVFPSDWDETLTGKIKDRKGEIFYYMHQQMVARYDSERLSNDFIRVLPLENFQEEMLAYSPHMTSQTTGVHFGSRPEGLKLKDLPNVSLQDIETWRIRILQAINQGYVEDASGNRVSLLNEKGIDILGSLVEASSSSVNPGFYGNLHNMGHNMISFAHDPDGRHRQQPNVMYFTQSAARDPMFYRWHKFIDNIFQRHKSTLKPYTKEELSFNGIRIVKAEVKGKEKNVLETYMRESRSDLSHAPFLKTKGKILVKYEHLDHEPFSYSFNIMNSTCEVKNITLRVFLAPKYDETGKLFDPNEQRLLMIELDKIKEYVSPGMNTITRIDTSSSVTTSSQTRPYRSIMAGNVEPEPDFCSCGWPEHMLIPRGKPNGMDFNLFVMCTDYSKDKPKNCNAGCGGTAVSYCGSRDQVYPDKKPMGFPFDRQIKARSMRDFLTENMILADVKIKFLEEVQPVTDWTVQMYGNM